MPCPLPPLWGGPVVVSPPRLCGAVCSTEIWYGCCRLLALVTIQNMMLLFSPCKRCPCPCSDAVLRSCEEALAGIILHRPPSLWFAWVRSGCAGPLEAGAARGGGVGGGPGPESMYPKPQSNCPGPCILRGLVPVVFARV